MIRVWILFSVIANAGAVEDHFTGRLYASAESCQRAADTANIAPGNRRFICKPYEEKP